LHGVAIHTLEAGGGGGGAVSRQDISALGAVGVGVVTAGLAGSVSGQSITFITHTGITLGSAGGSIISALGAEGWAGQAVLVGIESELLHARIALEAELIHVGAGLTVDGAGATHTTVENECGVTDGALQDSLVEASNGVNLILTGLAVVGAGVTFEVSGFASISCIALGGHTLGGDTVSIHGALTALVWALETLLCSSSVGVFSVTFVDITECGTGRVTLIAVGTASLAFFVSIQGVSGITGVGVTFAFASRRALGAL